MSLSVIPIFSSINVTNENFLAMHQQYALAAQLLSVALSSEGAGGHNVASTTTPAEQKPACAWSQSHAANEIHPATHRLSEKKLASRRSACTYKVILKTSTAGCTCSCAYPNAKD